MVFLQHAEYGIFDTREHMKKIKALPTAAINNMAVIKQKMPEKKHMLIGICLCFILAVLLFLLSQTVRSEQAELTKKGEAVFSPVDGIIYEMLIPKGQQVRKGDAIIRFDPAYIRTQVAAIREYLRLFQENRHNPGTLRQIFKPLLGDVFSGITEEIISLSAIETQKLAELQQLNREHAKAQIAMRRPSAFIDGKPDPALIQKEKDVRNKIAEAEKALENASTARSLADKKYRDLTNSLGQANSILYRYLEEEYNKALLRQKNEYLYAPFDAVAGIHYVGKGSAVQKDQILMDLHPQNAQEWWVRAVFAKDDAKKLKERDICTVETEDGIELEARIFSIEEGQNKTVVKLFILDPPKDLQASEFVTVENK